ncbi:MAG: hypothetical protein AAGF71_06590 [Pseudomonadota bacterium]
MAGLNVRVPFFRPLWRRVAVTAACFAWAVVETVWGHWAWAILMGAIGGYLTWEFFVAFKEEDYSEGDAP